MRDKTDTIPLSLSGEALLSVLAALGSAPRLQILARLSESRQYVSELARQLSLGRPLVHMHLKRLEEVGLITGHLELSTDGKAVKYYEIVAFDFKLSPEVIHTALSSKSKKPIQRLS